jgi:hypothetical protein
MTFYPRPGGPETAYYYIRAVDDTGLPSSPSNTVGSHGYLIENEDGNLTLVNIADNSTLVKISPNPFNSSVALRFEMRDASPVDLIIYDITGKEVCRLASGNSQLGANEVIWNAEGMPSGIYFARLSAVSCQLSASDGQSIVQKLLLIK